MISGARTVDSVSGRCPVRRGLLRAGLLIAVALLFVFFSCGNDIHQLVSQAAEPQPDMPLAPQEAVAQAAAQEDALLSQLRALQLDIERKQAEAAELETERTGLLDALARLELEQDAVAQRHTGYQTALAGILASWQTAGPGSRLELLLTSESLSVFLHRLSAMRQLDRDMSALLADMSDTRAELAAGEVRLRETLETAVQKERKIAAVLAQMHSSRTELEASLVSLRADRSRYEAMLAELVETWEQAMSVFPALTEGFSDVIAAGGFPEDALEMSFGLSGMTAVMREERFADIIERAEGLPPLSFGFQAQGVSLDVPEAELHLIGRFVIEDGVTLVYRPLSGTQGGLSLTEEQLADLSRHGVLALQLEPILMGTAISQVIPGDGFLTLSIRMRLW